MKRITALVTALVLTVCALFAMTLNVSAASVETKEGLEVTISTDKTEYAAGEDILITIIVKNTNSYAVELPTIETLLPDGLVLISGNAVEHDITVAAGATATVSVTAQLPIPEPPVTEPEPPVTEPEPPVAEPEPPVTEPPVVEPEPPKTGMSIQMFVAALLVILSIVGIIAACKSKRGSKMLTLVLCFAMLLTFAPLTALAEENTTVLTEITVDTTIKAGGNEYTIVGKINKQTTYETTFNAVDENGDEMSDVEITVTCKDEGAAEYTQTIVSGQMLYLFVGSYDAVCTVDGQEFKKEFVVSDAAQTVIINVAFDGTLSGRICRASDYITAISGASIEVYQNDLLVKNIVSDDSGNYSMTLPAGRYFVRITAENYITFEAYARIIGRQNTYMETFLLIEGSEADSGIASGKVVNSLTGYGLGGVALSVRKNWNNSDENAEIVATTVTDDNGNYSFELPLGNYTVIASKDQFTSSSFNIIVQEGTTSNQNGKITPIIEESDEANYFITLTWGRNPRDLDSHVEGTHLNGDSFHVYYRYKNVYDENGDLLCSLDYDDTDSYGPEHITLNTTADTPYYYYIHRFSDSGSLVTSGAKITVERNNVLIAEFNVPTDLSGNNRYWNVFAIKSCEIVISNTITSSPDLSYAN